MEYHPHLRDQDDRFSKCMSNPKLVKHVRVTSCAVCYKNPRLVDCVPDIRHDRVCRKEIVGPYGTEAEPLSNSFNMIFVYWFQLVGERHQYKHVGWSWRLGGATENRGADYRVGTIRG